MATQRALRVLESEPHGAAESRVTLELACGCRATLNIASDRIQTTLEGERIAVGKYSCPEGHETAKV